MSKTIGHLVDCQLQRLASSVARLRPKLKRRPQGPAPIAGVCLGNDPIVLAMTDFAFKRSLTTRPDFWAARGDRSLMVILLRSWEILVADDVAEWTRIIKAHVTKFPKHRVLYAANAPAELEVLARANIEGVWCNHNAFVDERVFKPLAEARAGDPRDFDAIYDARFARYKRHHLAARVPRLALVRYDNPELIEPLWTVSLLARLPRARILNRHHWSGLPITLSPKQVAAANNRAHVGLCLSEVEGAMVASIQYLLCGLPVVTTPSRGGRDVFFDAENSLVVEPETRAVASGVRALIDRKIDPWKIRAGAIARMEEHRARLFTVVEAFQREHGGPEAPRLSQEWMHRMGNVFKDRVG